MKQLLQHQWQHGGWLSVLLLPLSWLTQAVVALKRHAYGRGWRSAQRVGVPVIVVGNIFVGGTGKTPFILATIAALRERGWHPGVISRGYGIEVGAQPRVGQGQLDARLFGDEPALIARASGVPIAIHPRRAGAAGALLQAYPEVDVILSDDGLQHLALARNIEIAVQDRRGVGNGRLLPAGPLREPPSRLDEVDAVVTNATADMPATAAASATSTATGTQHGRPRCVTMTLQPTMLRRVTDGHTSRLDELPAGSRIAAAAGIGQPERFFTTLRQAGISPAVTIPLPDHHDYASSPFQGLAADVILVTEKDAVKCGQLNDPRIWAVPVTARLSDPTFFDWLDTRLHGQTPARHSVLPDHQRPAAP